VPNLHRVSAALYRGGHPTAEGLGELGRLGVRTIVNLRSLQSDRDDIAGLDREYVHIPMTPNQPKDQDVARFLKVVTDPSRAAVFVHCQYGADRTGTMVAMYRIAVQGWDAEQAIREMTCGGYGFHEYWDNLVDYIRKVDVERIRRQAGLAVAASRAAGE
jgi:protein tyrosine/serine phosphatase